MKNYAEKMSYLVKRQDGLCDICGHRLHGVGEKVDLHHRAHNTAWRRKKYPLFVDSVINMLAVHHFCHMTSGGHAPITDYNAERYERFLERHPKIAAWVNCDNLRGLW